MTTSNARIGGALVGGYLLGRTRKAKMAIGLGMFLAGRKLSLDPQQLAKMASNSPALSGLSNQARKELVDATKSAATSALTKRANSMADTLHERTLDLGGTPGESEQDAEERASDTDAEDSEDTEKNQEPSASEADEDTDGGDTERRPGARRKSPAKRSSGKASSGKAAAGKAASAKPASGKAASGKARAPGSRKASGTGKAASGARRKTSDRGGDDG